MDVAVWPCHPLVASPPPFPCPRSTRQRKLPKAGWADAHIELLLHEMAMLDSNTFLGWAAGLLVVVGAESLLTPLHRGYMKATPAWASARRALHLR